MKPYKKYDETKAYTESERLPVGGYILKIINVKEQSNTWGNKLIIAFDIAEGEYKEFFDRNFKEQQQEDKKWKGVYRLSIPDDEDDSDKAEWTARKFKTVMDNIEESNDGYHWNWDEKTLKNKKIGALFNNKEYDFNGRNGFFTNCHSLVPAEKIKSGKFTIPADTLLKKNGTTQKPDGDGFMNIPDGIDEELPF